jgi:hypothetical protein
VPKLSITFEENHSRAHENFKEQNEGLDSYKIIITYCIITIINAYYNNIFNV